MTELHSPSLHAAPILAVAHDAPPQRESALERVAIAAATICAELDVLLLAGDLDSDIVIAHRNLSKSLGQLRSAAPRRRRAKKPLPGGPRPVPTSDARGYSGHRRHSRARTPDARRRARAASTTPTRRPPPRCSR